MRKITGHTRYNFERTGNGVRTIFRIVAMGCTGAPRVNCKVYQRQWPSEHEREQAKRTFTINECKLVACQVEASQLVYNRDVGPLRYNEILAGRECLITRQKCDPDN